MASSTAGPMLTPTARSPIWVNICCVVAILLVCLLLSAGGAHSLSSCPVPFAGQIAADNPHAQELKRSDFLVIDTKSVGPNSDITNRYQIDDRGRPLKDPDLGGGFIRAPESDDDSVDPQANYNAENKVDMFESVDTDSIDVLDQMKQGVSEAGFQLLAYIVVNFVCEAVKCPTSRDNLAEMHDDIFTWLQVRHLAYAITLVEHHINR